MDLSYDSVTLVGVFKTNAFVWIHSYVQYSQQYGRKVGKNMIKNSIRDARTPQTREIFLTP